MNANLHLVATTDAAHPALLKHLRGEELTAADHAALREAGIKSGDTVLVEYPDTPEAQHMRSLIDRRLGYGEPLTLAEQAELDAWRQRTGGQAQSGYNWQGELDRQRETLDRIETLLAALPPEVSNA